jgi:citrate synthase
MDKAKKEIKNLILDAAKKARKETSSEPEPSLTKSIEWPVECTVGPGLEGAIACESKIGYVNGSKGSLIYRGYDIFDLCAESSFEEVSYLLLHGSLPSQSQLKDFKDELIGHRKIKKTIDLLKKFPIRRMNAMAALRLGTDLMRQEFSYTDQYVYEFEKETAIGTDEDSIPMETKPMGEEHAIYEFKKGEGVGKLKKGDDKFHPPVGFNACYQLISGVASVAGTIARLQKRQETIDPDPKLSHAGNLIYMLTGNRPSPLEEKVMDVALILHADHGMNASTFATMVVASTLSDMYFAVGAGIGALNGPLHGGANAEVISVLSEIGSQDKVDEWYKKVRAEKKKIMGFGHRVYKAYDPRARILGPLAKHLIASKKNKKLNGLLGIAENLEEKVISTLGEKKKIFPNVDFYSGLVYSCLGISTDMFTPLFAVSRVSGWTARVMEYLENNRIFRPRASYTGSFGKEYTPLEER